jgi:DNA polymerase delta subunit 2
VTGIVVAIYGKETGAGDFLVHELLEAGLPPQIEFPIKSSISSQSFTYTMLLT